jgi:F-type H+-transporting ATPase subunit gamma
MSGAKEIRSKISSIAQTKKITKAMELVAASKMRKAQERMRLTQPYANKALQVISHVANANAEFKHPFMMVRELKRVGYIVISSDRGLCGGLNNVLFKQVIQQLRSHQEEGIEVDLCLIGSKVASFFRKVGGNVIAHATHMGDSPTVQDLIGLVKVMLDKYKDNTIDAVYLCYNKFVNTMTQQPQLQAILPLQPASDKTADSLWDYIYEPNAETLLDILMTRYIESQVYQGVVENAACEQAARMVAMKSATDNAGQLIDDLKLAYNKARQAMITREISEIVSGAEAIG